MSSPTGAEQPKDISPWEACVRQYSQQSAAEHFYSGNHIKRFASFLEGSEHADLEGPRDDESGYAVLYDFQRSEPKLELHSPAELEQVRERNALASCQSQLLFLRGYPSPSWLIGVGKMFDVDVEFMLGHMWLYSKSPVELAWTNPPLISEAVVQPRLRMSTLGHLDYAGDHAREVGHVRRLRQHGAEVFTRYLRRVRREENSLRRGASLLRGISVHDAANFSYAQDVSIWTKKTEKGWLTLVWLDFGQENLALGTEGKALLAPLGGQSDNTVFSPMVPGRVADAMRKGSERSGAVSSHKEPSEYIVQNGMHLWKNYDQNLNLDLARNDAFYALSKLFDFAAKSEMQFLNMIRHVVSADIARTHVFNRDDASLSNLPYNQHVLNEHMQNLKANVAVIHKRERWPRLPGVGGSDLAAIESEGNRLLDDFEDLLQRARDLADECDRGVRNVMNLADHAEARKGIAQAERVEWLTRLAFVFIPMSFTASFFGMNFSEFGQGHLRIWIWFAVTVPVFVLSLVLMVTKLRQNILRRIRAFYHHVRGHENEYDMEMQRHARSD